MVWPKRIGDYIVGSVLGHGSFGEVRLGQHIKTYKACAVKILRYDVFNFDEHSRDIRREMSILMALHHPFVVSLQDMVCKKNKLYLVMELAESDLESFMQSHGALSETTARRYFSQLVFAVLHCHTHGVFHRDIKPENLLLTDKFSTLKVADFGFAAVVDKYSSEHRLMKTVCGSGSFCAPEVLRGDTYDGALADSYSCGVVLYRMLVGVDNFEKLWNDGELVLKEDFDDLDSVSEQALNLVRNLTQRNPGERITLQEARRHPWLTNRGLDASVPAASNVKWFTVGLSWLPQRSSSGEIRLTQ